jgi:RNA polymerase sigma-70 factor (ECF subfamily)
MGPSARAAAGGSLPESELERFERAVLPLMDDAYTLARYLTRDDHDAQDVVQEAYLRALRHFAGYRGGDARAWLLAIVRNCCYTWKRRERVARRSVEYAEDEHGLDERAQYAADAGALEEADRSELRTALDRLPSEFREAIVLREIEGMSYKEIGRVIGVPVGTVMSRLSRARTRLREALRVGAREAS